MVYFSPKVLSSQWSLHEAEDFETALLNQPLREFAEIVKAGDLQGFAALEALQKAVKRALTASAGHAEEQTAWDLEPVRLLASWSVSKSLPRELPPCPDGDVQQALTFLAECLLPQDLLCRFASDLSRCSSEEELDARIEEWNAHRDSMILSSPLSVERLQAAEALGRAMHEWQRSEPTSIPWAITAAQWRVIASLIRPSEELPHGSQETLRAIRGLLRSTLKAMELEWVSPEPRFTAEPACDLRRKMAALRLTPLAQSIPFEIWGILEGVQSAWMRGSHQPPHGFDKAKEFLGIRSRAERPPHAEASTARQPRPVTDRDRSLALRILEKQKRKMSEGGQGVHVPLLSVRAVGTQLHDGESLRFREKWSRSSQSREVDASSSSVAMPLEAQSLTPAARAEVADPIQEQLDPQVWDLRFRMFAGLEELEEGLAAAERIPMALSGTRSDRDLVEEMVVGLSANREDDQGEFFSFLTESLQVDSQTDAFREGLEPVLNRLHKIEQPQVQEWLRPLAQGGVSVEPTSLFASVATALHRFEQYMRRHCDGAPLAFVDHQEAWEVFLIEASNWVLSPWARAQFLAAGLKALQGLETDRDGFEGALESLGSREARRLAIPLQRLYGACLVKRAALVDSAAQRLASLRQILGSPTWQAGWGPLAEALSTGSQGNS